MLRLAATVVVSATFAILGAGCGGDTSAEEEWAGDVCSSVSNWQDQARQSAEDVREALQSPGAGTVETLETEVREIIDATQEVGNDLQELEPPDTEAGEEAKQEIDTLATQLESTATNIEETFDNLPDDAGLSDLANALEPLVPTIQSLIASVSSTFDAVKESGSELKEAFENADSCDEFR